MSKYKFRKKDSSPVSIPLEDEDVKIMNASAGEDENTTVFSTYDNIVKASRAKDEEDNSFFNPFDEIEQENKKHKKHKKHSKSDSHTANDTPHSSHFSFSSFLKNINSEKDNSDDTEIDIVSKVEDIYQEKETTIDDIKENLASGKKIELADVFSDKKKSEPVAEESSASVTDDKDGEEDTYDIEEDTLDDSVEEASEEENDVYSDSDNDDELPPPVKKVREKKVKEIRDYNDPEEKEEFTELYRKKGQISLVCLVATSVLALLLIFLETKSIHPGFLDFLTSGKYNVPYLMIDLQLVLFTAVCVIKQIFNGAAALFTWKPNKNSITFIAFAVSVIQIILHYALSSTDPKVSLFSSVFGVCAVVSALFAYVDGRREHISFRAAASSKTKYVASPLDETSAEYGKFSEYLDKDASLYRIEKASFVSDFFKTNARRSPFDEMYKVSIPLSLLASIVFAILSFAISKEDVSAARVINNFAMTFMMSLPLSSIFVVSLPFFITTLRLSKRDSAIIGEKSIDEYADTSLVSFADTDVFHEKGIKVTSIKTYGKSRIDNTYLVAARAFNLLGGPLKAVFNRSVISTSGGNADDRIESVTANGFKAVIDSSEVLIGNETYIVENGYSPIEDTIDSAFETSNGRIMYIVLDKEISAKFYIKYAIGRNFKALLDSFCNIGICMAVNTRDPNLDTKFLTQILKVDAYPIVIVKNEDVPSEEETLPKEKATSGIISASSVSNMLRSFLSADKLARVISTNTLTKYICLIFALVIIVVAFINGASHEKITPLFIILYQIIWSLPIIGASFFN